MMQHYPILAIMIYFLGAFLTVLAGKNKTLRYCIVGAAVTASFVLMLLLIKPIMIDGQIIAYWLGNWEPVAGYAIGIGIEVDALSLFFGLLVTGAVFLGAIYSFRYMEYDDTLEKFYTLLLMLSGAVLGLVLSCDLFNMFIMVEIMTFAAVALTAFRNNTKGALEAGFKYLVVGTIGSTSILTGTVLLYSQFRTLNLAQLAGMVNGNLNTVSVLAFALLLTGYMCKSFVIPFHPLAVDAYAAAPSSISMIFSGVVNKAGIYGVIRIVYFVFRSMDISTMQFLLVLVGTVTMFVGVTMALSQREFKRLLAYHSVSQLGYVLAAVGLSTGLGIAGGLYHALNHTLFKGLLFLTAGAVLRQTGSTDLDDLGGLSKRMPQTCAVFLIGAASISGLPPFNGFASKWTIYQAVYEKAAATGNIGYALVLIVALVVSVMTLASFVKVAQSVFFGQLPEKFEKVEEAPAAMQLPMWVMAGLCVASGLFPDLLMKYLVQPAATAVLSVGNYVNSMMGAGTVNIPAVEISFAQAGYWSPLVWVILLVICLAAVMIVAVSSKRANGPLRTGTAVEYKYQTFYSGEESEHSMVGGSDLFWGFKHNMKKYFDYMHEAHSGVVNDYALWMICAMAVVILYMFITH